MAGLLILAPLYGHAATVGTATFAVANLTPDGVARTVTITWTGDGSTGGVSGWVTDNITVPTAFCRSGATFGASGCTLTEAIRGYYLLTVSTKPGTTAPTSYGATWTDALGVDLFNGAVTSRSTSAAQSVNVQTNQPLSGPYTFALSGQSTASGTGTMVLYLLYSGVQQ
jgi:hypothetical protein